MTYIITAATLRKEVFFDQSADRDLLVEILFEQAGRFGWKLHAWAVMANHYHFVARAPEDSATLEKMIRAIHSISAISLNKRHATPGRKVWFQYWDTCLTNERSYFARLNYVHHNPERHGVVESAESYRWCSMGWFMKHAAPAFRRTVMSFPIDEIKVPDDF